MIEFVVYGDPAPKGSAKAFIPKGWTRPVITSATKGLKDWERKIAAAANTVADGKLLIGPIHINVLFYLSRPKSLPRTVRSNTKRPDLDKLVRGATDALTGIIWKDDSQLVHIQARKLYVASDADAPCAKFAITEVWSM